MQILTIAIAVDALDVTCVVDVAMTAIPAAFLDVKVALDVMVAGIVVVVYQIALGVLKSA